WSGRLQIRAALDGQVRNAGVSRYQGLSNQHLNLRDSGCPDRGLLHLLVETSQSRLQVAQSARLTLSRRGEPLHAEPTAMAEPGCCAALYEVDVAEGVALCVEKVLALFTSRDTAISECALESRKAATEAPDFATLADSHGRIWSHLWQRFDLQLGHPGREPDNRNERILHLHLFHVLQTASPNTMDLDVGIPARGLHGEAYRGHIFWDELFVFPMLNLRVPEITASLLRYRYRRLGEARRAARAAGFRGAMYPWQSASNGREESQRLHLNPQSGRWIEDHSRLQRHVSSAIAYNVWQYYEVTRDLEFLSFYGAEMILEIARFWADAATYNEHRRRYDILGVMGPDEYHDAYPEADAAGLNNNAYTNVLAAWVLCRALALPSLLPVERYRELRQSLSLEPEELDRWDTISRTMFLPFHDQGILSQFEGYERLSEFDWEGYRARYGDIQRLDRLLEAEGDSPNRYKASKQADVLMLFYLFSAEELEELFARLGYAFPPETIPRNIEYYLQRTSHGSTLSRVVHAWVVSRSDRDRSWELFTRSLDSDVTDIQGGTTKEGIHMGAMGGTLDLVQRCYTGVVTRGDTLWFNPALPAGLSRLSLNLRYRGHSLGVWVTPDTLRLSAAPGGAPAIRLGVAGQVHEVAGGETREFRLHRRRRATPP
ncbi:MAG TPA: glycosyl hydrolase family 65 protein, partial [Gammaproteobacteria bacterium]|nr:glycosyl hydrolase family 65 protein [Gammaproteobacteria bacterium]